MAGYAAFGLTITAWASYGVRLVAARESGLLKRWRASPLPRWCYLAGAILATTLTAAIAGGVAVGVAVLLWGTHFDAGPSIQLTGKGTAAILIVFLLAALAWASAATAVTSLIPSVEAAFPTLTLIYFPLVIISGVLFSLNEPHWLSTLVTYLPAQPISPRRPTPCTTALASPSSRAGTRPSSPRGRPAACSSRSSSSAGNRTGPAGTPARAPLGPTSAEPASGGHRTCHAVTRTLRRWPAPGRCGSRRRGFLARMQISMYGLGTRLGAAGRRRRRGGAGGPSQLVTLLATEVYPAAGLASTLVRVTLPGWIHGRRLRRSGGDVRRADVRKGVAGIAGPGGARGIPVSPRRSSRRPLGVAAGVPVRPCARQGMLAWDLHLAAPSSACICHGPHPSLTGQPVAAAGVGFRRAHASALPSLGR